ncbi:MAG: DUF885 domain-containing protein [Gammaproteobacteria bacterium]|nr:DUF885 domain-containing protein [Gammaproteobacteria bacterium]
MNRILGSFLLLVLLLPLAHGSQYQTARENILEQERALATNAGELSESKRFNALLDLYFQYTMLEFPEFATFIGHPSGQDRWTDNSIKAIKRRESDSRRALEILEAIDRDSLDGVDRLNYDLYLDGANKQVEGIRFPQYLLPVTQLNGIQQDSARTLSVMPRKTTGQLKNIVARLEALPESIENVTAHLKTGLQAGVTPPAITLRDIPDQIAALLTDDPMESALMTQFKNRSDGISKADWNKLTKRATRAYKKSVAPAFRRLHEFFVTEYLPGARKSIAATELPDGQAWYAYRIRQMTTTDLTAEEIHALGQTEVKRIRAKMDEIIVSTGFEGDFADFTEFLRNDSQFYFDSANDLITAYRDISKRADAATVRVIGKLPRLPYGVEAIPDFIAKSQTTAYYQQGSQEAGRAGTFFANTYDLKTRPSWEMEALSLHEAVPGHHLQLSLQAEIDMPWFRRFGGETAFVEGWGLYSESLGEEMGFYEDPYSKFGQLTYEMWRAVRLVVDTGMHALGWTRDDAIQFFKDNASKTEHDITVEIDRYIVWPAQALAYKIGELRIKELRARAESALGQKFNVRHFHDAVLANGAVPLNVLESQIDEWIATQQAKAASIN